jgi:hypothetical protein
LAYSLGPTASSSATMDMDMMNEVHADSREFPIRRISQSVESIVDELGMTKEAKYNITTMLMKRTHMPIELGEEMMGRLKETSDID